MWGTEGSRGGEADAVCAAVAEVEEVRGVETSEGEADRGERRELRKRGVCCWADRSETWWEQSGRLQGLLASICLVCQVEGKRTRGTPF